MSALPLALLVVAGVVYHLSLKAAGAANPWPMLVVAYATALALTLPLALASGEAPGRRESVAGLLIGLAAFGIEAGFFIVYRAGWPLATASVLVGAAVTSILALIGVFVLGEPLGASRTLGLVLAFAGGTLIARG